MTLHTFAPGDLAMQAWYVVEILAVQRKYGQDGYRVQRTEPEPVGFNPDGSIMTSTGLPFWIPARDLKPLPAKETHA